jgi:hypothetical protein
MHNRENPAHVGVGFSLFFTLDYMSFEHEAGIIPVFTRPCPFASFHPERLLGRRLVFSAISQYA